VTSRIRSMLPVLERRETKARLTLARLTRGVEKKQASVRAMQRLIDALQAGLRSTLAGRYSDGACTVAALTELEQHVRTLHASTEQVTVQRERAQHEVDELAARQRVVAQRWRRCEVRLDHVAALARHERIASALAASEVDEELHAERQAAVRASR
jgi:hypothetical protein